MGQLNRQPVPMKRIHVVGRKNHGKTTLIVELMEELLRRGLRVGSIKHSRHRHELDTPGKDSFLHGHAGANPTAIITCDAIGVYVRRGLWADPWRFLAPMFAQCELVLVEGGLDLEGTKIEVWRRSLGGACLATERDDIAAVVSDDRPDARVPIWPRGDLNGLAEKLLTLAPGA